METLKRFNELYKKLNETASRLAKEKILAEYKDDKEIKNILNFLFNPFIVTGLSGKKISKAISLPLLENEQFSLAEILDYFKKHNTGRDEDIVYLKSRTAALDNELCELLYSIIKKDITLGASEITLNKVFGSGFIPSFNVMLAEKYSENYEYIIGKKFIITEKLDGVRCMLVFNDSGEPTFFSRAGKTFSDLIEIAAEAENLAKDYVYDGELLLDKKAENSADLYRMTVKVTSCDGIKKNLIFNVFDCFPKADLMLGGSPIPCEKRKEKIINLPHIKSVPILYIGDDINKINELCDKYTDMGKEGVMVNIADAPYQCKRTKDLLKVKRFNAADVRVIEWEEGSGANKGKLGAVIVEFIAPDNKIYTCKVGSGFGKEDREIFYKNPDKIVGHIIEIGYFELSRNQNDDGYSLRFPTYKHLRDDKTEISMH
jgi:DNA ligase-1